MAQTSSCARIPHPSLSGIFFLVFLPGSAAEDRVGSQYLQGKGGRHPDLELPAVSDVVL